MQFQLDESGQAFLQLNWENLCARHKANPTDAKAIFDLLVQNYSEPRRTYHNLSHIRALFRHAESFRQELQNYEAVSFAIWFHDAVYNTRKGDNEEKSAELAVGMLGKLLLPPETINAVEQMILATKKHELLNDSADLKLFLDFDLSILGTSQEVYQRYSQAIRKEYSWVPYFLYRKGRKKVLESFLKRERIYFSDVMKARLETQARRNIESELSQL